MRRISTLHLRQELAYVADERAQAGSRARGCVRLVERNEFGAGNPAGVSRPLLRMANGLRHRAMQHQSRSRNARQQVEEIEIPKRLQQLAHFPQPMPRCVVDHSTRPFFRV